MQLTAVGSMTRGLEVVPLRSPILVKLCNVDRGEVAPVRCALEAIAYGAGGTTLLLLGLLFLCCSFSCF